MKVLLKQLFGQAIWDFTRPAPWLAGQPAYPNEGMLSTKKYN